MKPLQRKYEALKGILREAYYEREHAEIDEQWQVDAMRRMRGLGPITSGRNFFVFFERLLWRLTPATCVLIVLFTALLFKLNFTPEYEVFTSLVYDTGEITLEQLFGF